MQDSPRFDPIRWVEDVAGTACDIVGRGGYAVERREQIIEERACPNGEAMDSGVQVDLEIVDDSGGVGLSGSHEVEEGRGRVAIRCGGRPGMRRSGNIMQPLREAFKKVRVRF